VVSIFRVADILILLGIWACHHYFKHNVHFFELEALWKQGQTVVENPFFALLIPLIFLVTAMVKSAQWPFSSWLPRAMEGPTTSSAIFYGSMSVHMGVFLLLRTYPFWAENWTIKTIIIVIGAMTGLIGTFTARVQSTVKTQIAYSSVAQIGIMFIEVALGWRLLALVHFTGNAFLRTYQLLVSPSVLSYLIHDQFFNFIPPQHNITQTFWGKLRLSVYVMSIKEWKMDTAMYYTLWRPLKIVGGKLGALGFNGTLMLFIPLYLLGLYFVYHKNALPFSPTFLLPEFMAFCGLCLILMAFTARYDARRAWVLVMLNQLFITLAIGFNEQFDLTQIHI
jgi:NADH:ubiquinone oxidoreductase subunit 5 (subunit L)/multisubunit Na+/H+ antiporter MnhA subunit